VNRVKLTSFLLIAVLCYGQIVASVHQAGHIGAPAENSHHDTSLHGDSLHGNRHHTSSHGSEHGGSHAFSINFAAGLGDSDPHKKTHSSASGTTAENSAFGNRASDKSASVHDASDHAAELDCEIYHSLLGFSAVLRCERTLQISLLQQTTRPAYQSIRIVSSALKNQTIRGPPSYS